MSDRVAEPLEPKGVDARPTSVRWLVLLALALVTIVAYLVRVAPSPAGTTIQKELGFTDPTWGAILAGFYLGYVWTQIPGGWLGGRIGARASLVIYCLLWSAAIFWASLADSYAAVYASRIAVGLAQGGLFPVMAKVITQWFPAHQRGLASSIPTGCMSIGSAIAQGLTVRLLQDLAWQGVFRLYALLGVAWSVVFAIWYRNRPEEHPWVNAEECRLIQETPAGTQESKNKPGSSELDFPADMTATEQVATLASSVSLWAHCGQAVFRAFYHAFFFTWCPAYLERRYGVSVKEAGYLSALPLIAVFLGSPVGGWAADRILTRTGSRWLSRSGLSIFALLFCGVLTVVSALPSTALWAVLVISLGMLVFGFTGPTTWAVTMDIGGRQTALIFAIMNTAGNLGAWSCPMVVGYLNKEIAEGRLGFNSVLWLLCGINVAAAVCWAVLDPNKPAVRPRGERDASGPAARAAGSFDDEMV